VQEATRRTYLSSGRFRPTSSGDILVRVIEQLIQHFWQTGELSRANVQTLLDHGFIRPENLPGWVDRETSWSEPETTPDDPWEEEETPVPRTGGKARRGKDRPTPVGHDLAPLSAILTKHFALRTPYPALVELGQRLRLGGDWPRAAAAIGTTEVPSLAGALVGLLNVRPRALGELWFWCDVSGLEVWSQLKPHKGPVIEALLRLLRAATLFEAGRVMQLLKAPEVQHLLALLAARRRLLAVLPTLYEQHFGRLGQWLVPPTGRAASGWPALPWAYLLRYNARRVAAPPLPGYPTSWEALSDGLRERAWTTAWSMDPASLPALLPAEVRTDPLFPARDPKHACPRVRMPLHCPLNWRV
jgi:hypothetical protein